MDETKILEAINGSMTNFTEAIGGKLDGIPEAIKKAFESKETASVKEEAKVRQLAGITEFEVWDVPVGKALFGGFVAVVGSELVDGFLANQGDMVIGLVKLAGAGAIVKWGSRLLGKGVATAVALLLAYDGIRHILPIDQYAHQLASKVSGVVTTRGLGGNKGSALGDAGNGKGKTKDYYAGLMGGRR